MGDVYFIGWASNPETYRWPMLSFVVAQYGLKVTCPIRIHSFIAWMMPGTLFALHISTRLSECLLHFKSDITDMTSYYYKVSVIIQMQNMS